MTLKNISCSKSLCFGWTTTATNIHPESIDNSISISGKLNKTHKITSKRKDLRGHEITGNIIIRSELGRVFSDPVL